MTVLKTKLRNRTSHVSRKWFNCGPQQCKT
jgi:hypothetical protein